MKKSSLFKTTLTAMFCALVVAMTFIPFTGYISIGVALSITTLHVVVILGAVLLGPARGTVLGAVWGITCLIYAFMNGTADAVIFTDPRVSVIPRILVGLAAGWYYVGFKKLFEHIRFSRVFQRIKMDEILAAGCTALCGTLTNTVLVLTAVTLFGTGFVSLGATLSTILKAAIAVNGVLETILAVVVVPAVSRPLFSMMKRYGM